MRICLSLKRSKTTKRVNSLFADGLGHSGVKRCCVSILGQLAVAAVHGVHHEVVGRSCHATNGVMAW